MSYKFQITIGANSVEELLSLLNHGAALNIAASFGVAATEDIDAGPVNLNAPAIDPSGLPWDERIHSATKAQNADGTWRKRRGINDTLYNGVVAELRARPTSAGAASLAPPPSPVVAAAPVTTPISSVMPMPPTALPPTALPPTATAPFQTAVTAATAPAAAVVVNPLTRDPATATYADFMMQIAAGMGTGIITPTYATELAQRLQLNQLTDLMHRPDLVPSAYMTLQAEGKIAAS